MLLLNSLLFFIGVLEFYEIFNRWSGFKRELHSDLVQLNHCPITTLVRKHLIFLSNPEPDLLEEISRILLWRELSSIFCPVDLSLASIQINIRITVPLGMLEHFPEDVKREVDPASKIISHGTKAINALFHWFHAEWPRNSKNLRNSDIRYQKVGHVPITTNKNCKSVEYNDNGEVD